MQTSEKELMREAKETGFRPEIMGKSLASDGYSRWYQRTSLFEGTIGVKRRNSFKPLFL